MDITALLKTAVASTDDTKTVMVLGGTPVTLHASPLTANDLKIIGRKHPDFMLRPNVEGMVDLLILKAKDDNGEKVFTLEHKPLLMRLSTNITTGAFGDLFGEQLVSEDDDAQDARKGKSKATS